MNRVIVIRQMYPGGHSWVAATWGESSKPRPMPDGSYRCDVSRTWVASRSEAIYHACEDIPEPKHV